MTFDACDGSDENHYWDHHNGFTDTHVTGFLCTTHCDPVYNRASVQSVCLIHSQKVNRYRAIEVPKQC